MRSLIFLFLAFAAPVNAQSLIATRNIPPQTILSDADLTIAPQIIAGALENLQSAIGKETKVAIYTGRPVRAADLNRPAIIERNQLVALVYSEGGLNIRTEGRSLSRAGEGESVKAINLSSRTTVYGIVGPEGQIYVGGQK